MLWLMNRAARRCTLLLGLGLMTWSLQACIAQDPAGDEDSSGKKSDKTEDDKTEDDKTEGSKTAEKTEDAKKSENSVESDPKKGGSVSGVVVDEKGKGLAGISVQVCDEQCLEPARSDEDGKFKVSGVPESWDSYHATIGDAEDSMFFVGTIVHVKVDTGLEKVELGDLLHQVIDEDVKSTTFRDIKKKTVFETGKFSFELNPEEMDAGFFVDAFDEEKDNLAFAVAEIDEERWRDEEKKIDGKKIEAIWGVFPFGGYMNDGKSAALKIDDDLGFEDGDELVVFEQNHKSGEFQKAGTTEVKDGKIELDEGLTQFTRLYFAKK